MSYILTIDQGTSSTRSLVINEKAQIVSSSQMEHKQYYPAEAWVEHDPLEIKENVLKTMKEAVNSAKIDWNEIKSIGVTNQRETVVAWNKSTGIPLANAIVWQCRRTAPMIQQLINDGYRDVFHEKTGLVLDAYFSGTKIKWLTENVPKVSESLKNSELAVGTIDSWIIYFLTGNHKTDASNASRTLLYNLNNMEWDNELGEILKIPISILPDVNPNNAEPFGYFEIEGNQIPIRGVLGDQQAALFGHGAFNEGDMKSTYGTGNFILMNTGSERKFSKNGLLTTVGWQIGNQMTYAVEGSVFITGAALLWLRDGLGLINDYSEIDRLVDNHSPTSELFFVPAFVGLGAPHWDSSARGMMIGITRDTNKKDIVYATLESIAYQTDDLINVMKLDTNMSFDKLRVDGGITRSKALMQRQADISRVEIIVPENIETTALGAGLMAGLGSIWEDLDTLRELNPPKESYTPSTDEGKELKRKEKWKEAVNRSKSWA